MSGIEYKQFEVNFLADRLEFSREKNGKLPICTFRSLYRVNDLKSKLKTHVNFLRLLVRGLSTDFGLRGVTLGGNVTPMIFCFLRP